MSTEKASATLGYFFRLSVCPALLLLAIYAFYEILFNLVHLLYMKTMHYLPTLWFANQ